jgi:hypothetical protein
LKYNIANGLTREEIPAHHPSFLFWLDRQACSTFRDRPDKAAVSTPIPTRGEFRQTKPPVSQGRPQVVEIIGCSLNRLFSMAYMVI